MPRGRRRQVTAILDNVVHASVLAASANASTSELAGRLSSTSQSVLPAGDGLGWFNRRYQLVTASIGENLGANAFARSRLDDPATFGPTRRGRRITANAIERARRSPARSSSPRSTRWSAKEW